jgi:cell wall-associated NlpC family hydrolase
MAGFFACVWKPAVSHAAYDLETESPVSGFSVVLNNYYASREHPLQDMTQDLEPERIAQAVADDEALAIAEEQAAAESRAAAESQAAESLAAGGETGENGESTGDGTSADSRPDGGKQTAAGSQGGSEGTPYDNVAISQVSGESWVNVRSQAGTGGDVVGKLYNNCAATILETVDGEDGKWYRIQSGTVNGYIKAEFFITGKEAEAKAREVGDVYATVSKADTLRLRAQPNLESETLSLLSKGAKYLVTGEEGDFAKVLVDTDLEGYVFREYITTDVEFRQAVSIAEEKAKQQEELKREQEAKKAMEALEAAKKAQKEQEQKAAEEAKKAKEEAEKKAKEEAAKKAAEESKKAAEAAASATIEANTAPVGEAPPEGAPGSDGTVTATVEANTAAGAPTEASGSGAPSAADGSNAGATAVESAPTASEDTSEVGPGLPKGPAAPTEDAVMAATRTAIVAYAKQFLGNPYVYGGTSLTNGADCSGFTQSVFAHFGVTIGRNSREQAGMGREISWEDARPGDLLFYASGSYINHVAMYIGNGQVIHASNSTTGIIISPANYRTPCKAVDVLE